MKDKKLSLNFKFTGKLKRLSRGRVSSKPVEQIVNGGKIQRNDSCLCGSGKKWKKCCGLKVERVGCAEI